MGLIKIPRDIINIVLCIKSKDEKRRLNRNYYDKYEIYDSIKHRYGICLRYKNGSFAKIYRHIYFINYRDITRVEYRKDIVCFLTNTPTIYKVPKKY